MNKESLEALRIKAVKKTFGRIKSQGNMSGIIHVQTLAL